MTIVNNNSATGYGGNAGRAVLDGEAVTPTEQSRRDGIASAFDDLSRLLSDPAGVGPEMLIAMAEEQMSGIDGQLRSRLSDMSQRGKRVADLNAVTEAIGAWASTHNTHDDSIDPNGDPNARPLNDPDKAFDINGQTLTVEYADGSRATMTVADALRDAGVDLSHFQPNSHNGHVYLNSRSVQEFQGILSARAQSLNQGAEVQQLELQQIVSRRGQFMQLMSQVMNSLNETNKSIVGNTGR